MGQHTRMGDFRIGIRHRGRIVPAERGLGNDKPVHRREFPEWLHDERGLGIKYGVQPTSGIRETVQDLQGDFCNKLNYCCPVKIKCKL